MGDCAECGRELAGRAFECEGCGQRYCSDHRDQSDHACDGAPVEAGTSYDVVRVDREEGSDDADGTGDGVGREIPDVDVAFEETHGPNPLFGTVLQVLIFVSIGLPFLSFLANPGTPLPVLLVVEGAALLTVGAPLGLVLWWLGRTEVHTRVDEDAVEVTWRSSPPLARSGVRIPLREVTGVVHWENRREMAARTSNRSGSVRTTRLRQEWYGLRGSGVCVERRDDADVYVGSLRPDELAGAIARRADGVESPGEV